MNPSQFGFANVTSGCISSGSLAGNPQQFLVWDGIHPTTATHEILASNAFAALGKDVKNLFSALN